MPLACSITVRCLALKTYLLRGCFLYKMGCQDVQKIYKAVQIVVIIAVTIFPMVQAFNQTLH